MRRARALRLSWALAAWANVAGAEPSPAPRASVVLVSAPPCIERPYDRARLVELLRVEARALGVTDVVVAESSSPSREDGLLAVVVLTPAVCDGAAESVTIQVLDRASSKTVERRMTLSDVETGGRPRALAIAIAEILQASLAELLLAGAPPPRVTPPTALQSALVDRLAPAIDAARVSPERAVHALLELRDRTLAEREAVRALRERAPELSLAAEAWSFPSRGTALLGAAAGAHLRFAAHGFWEIGAEGGLGGTQVGQGSVAVRAISGSTGVGLATGGTTDLALGPRLEVGYGWATGSAGGAAVRGSTYGNAFLLALLSATLRVHGESRWTPLVGIDVGHTLLDVSFLSDLSRAAGLGGPVIAARLGVGLGL